MKAFIRSFAVLSAMVALASCSSVGGDLTVDDHQLAVESCHSLEPLGADGVDLELADGSTVRLFRMGTAAHDVGYFETPEAETGYAIGRCATGTIEDQSSLTNGVRDLTGDVTLDCDVVRRISGRVVFSNCH